MDFNLSNYQKNELQEMFQLPSDYNQELVDIQEKKLRDNIVNNPSIDENIKNKTHFFLQEAKHLLLTDVANFYNTRFDLKQTRTFSINIPCEYCAGEIKND